MDKLALLERTYQKLVSDKGFMAYYLGTYARQRNMRTAELIQELRCEPEQFYKLALCQAPERGRGDFTARLANIAGYSGVSLLLLDALMREVTSQHTGILPAFLQRWLRALPTLPAPVVLAGSRVGISALCLLFFVGVYTAKVDPGIHNGYTRDFSFYKDSVKRLCLGDNTFVSDQSF